jgi:aminopeptidase YwaD
MKTTLLIVLFAISSRALAQSAASVPGSACGPCIRAEEEFLASDALRGRGSGTEDEHIAATYLGSVLRRYGVEPAGDNGSYVQTVTITTRAVASAPRLTVGARGQQTEFLHGEKIIVNTVGQDHVVAPLHKLKSTKGALEKGEAVFIPPSICTGQACLRSLASLASAGAAILLIAADARTHDQWQRLATRLPPPVVDIASGAAAAGTPRTAVVLLGDEAVKAIAAAPDNTEINLFAELGPPQAARTWNTIGILRGDDPDHAVLLTAHLDHIGVGQAVNGDAIYNGADDDASGCAAVLELAHALATGPKPKRTVLFVMFGSEEKGGFGARYWLDHPTVPLDHLVANLEFEMIGRPDAAVKPDQLWLSGWERSNLGPELASHGARLVQDPHPEQNFFSRSDNIALARRGVVAQTVSSFGLHPDYHRPTDDVQHLDVKHMEEAIGSMIEPVKWLVNSDFVPQWNAGGKP